MLRVRDGDLDQLAVLFERYSGILYSFFMKRVREHGVSEDLTQEVFLRILRYRKTFKVKNNFRAWVFTIARNVQKTHWKKRFSKLHVVPSDQQYDAAPEVIDEGGRPDDETNRTQETALLYEALEKLPEEKQQLVVMRRIQDLSYAEMAIALNCDANTLKVRVHRAVAELAKHLNSLLKERPYELRKMQ